MSVRKQDINTTILHHFDRPDSLFTIASFVFLEWLSVDDNMNVSLA